MKNTLACPKCSSRKLWCINNLGTKDQSGGIGPPDPLLLAVMRSTRPTKPPSVWGDGSTCYDAGPIDAYACAQCGYTELWARDFEQLVHNPASGVHLIDATPQRGEYR